VFVVPGDEQSDPEKLKMTWEVLEFTEDEMVI